MSIINRNDPRSFFIFIFNFSSFLVIDSLYDAEEEDMAIVDSLVSHKQQRVSVLKRPYA